MIEEIRNYVRLEAKLDISYKLKDRWQVKKKTLTRNISAAGVSASVDDSIKKGDWLELAINIPFHKKPVTCIGKVAWTADKKAGKIGVGIKFEEIDPELKNMFLEYICGLMCSELQRSRV